jgi:hypothetical protein
MKPQAHPSQAARAEEDSTTRDAVPDFYGPAAEVPSLSPEIQAMIQEFQDQLTNAIVDECGRQIEGKAKTPANWYLAFAHGVNSTLPMQDDFVRRVVRFAEDTQNPDDPVDLDALDTACRQGLEGCSRLVGLLREQAAKC